MKEDEMNVTNMKVSVRDLCAGYVNDDESGTLGYHGRLNIRPPYQREFIYSTEQEQQVIHSVMSRFPLNIFYWSVCEDGNYELLDGQQRTLSICRFVNNVYAIYIEDQPKYFHNLDEETQKEILDYEIEVYTCAGTDRAKIKWFNVINTAGEKLTEQELLNAIYHGSWVESAKSYFVKGGRSCLACNEYGQYLPTVSVERQGLLELAIRWVSNGDIKGYMSQHQHDSTALGLWKYFRDVFDWVGAIFPVYRREMKGLNWGSLYASYHENSYDPDELEKRVKELYADDEVDGKASIYKYLLSGEEKYLHFRQFDRHMKKKKWLEQGKTCCRCHKEVAFEDCEGDHIVPWCEGGKTTEENLQILCRDCNRRKGSK